MSVAGVAPGDVLAGKYRVERVLGEGGMGVVVAAHHVQLDTKVALKFLLPAALDNPAAVARFVREARTAVRIQSEHVARVSDVGQLENGLPYMVMEYLEGGDLAGWLQQRGALPVEQAVEFVLQACVAVAEAHALGVIHRDLKPANLFCVRRSDGQLAIKVLDFGISKVTDAANPGVAMTKTSAVMGTPLYMSPEQIKSSKTVDARTDIWALGVILFELVAGRVPFLADTAMELAVTITNEPPPPLRSFRPDAPAELEAVIQRCVEKDPNRRYRTVGELAVALIPFAPKRGRVLVERVAGILQAAGLSASALDMPPSPHQPAAGATGGTFPAMGRTTAGGVTRTRAPILAIVGGLVFLGAVGTVLFLATRAHGTFDGTATLGTPAPTAATPSAPPPEMPSAATAPSATSPPSPPQPPPPALPRPTSMATATPSATAPHPATTKPADKPSAAQPICDPPYVINAAGHRVHKPECP